MNIFFIFKLTVGDITLSCFNVLLWVIFFYFFEEFRGGDPVGEATSPRTFWYLFQV